MFLFKSFPGFKIQYGWNLVPKVLLVMAFSSDVKYANYDMLPVDRINRTLLNDKIGDKKNEQRPWIVLVSKSASELENYVLSKPETILETVVI